MPVMLATEVNDILNLSASTVRNDKFTMFIKYVQEDVCEHLNNYFEDPVIYRDGGEAIEFVRGDTGAPVVADYITDTEARFSSVGFSTVNAYDIAVRGGSQNAGIHHVVSQTSAGGKMTLDSTGVLYNHDMDAMQHYAGGCKISLIMWPKAIKPYIAQMVWFRYASPTPSDIKSEKIDDYSVTFVGSHSYPTESVEGLTKWRNVVMA